MKIMYEITHDETHAYLRVDPPLNPTTVRASIPGAAWSGSKQYWSFPLTRRSMLALRRFLTGKSPLSITQETAQALREAADSVVTPDITVSGDRIVITFEYHKKYEEFVQVLDASRRQGGSWSVAKSRGAEVLELIDSLELDLVASPEVRSVSQEPIPGFNGSILSLKDTPLETLTNVANAKMAVKTKKKSPLTFADRLRAIGIKDLFDLALYFPLRYVDRSNPVSVSNMVVGETFTLVGTIAKVEANGAKRFVRIIVKDLNGVKIPATFFSQSWIASRFFEGQAVMVTGKYEQWKSPAGFVSPQLSSPRIDHLISSKSAPVIPIYPQSEVTGVSTPAVMRATRELFDRLTTIDDVLPIGEENKTISYDSAIRSMHFPQTIKETEDGRHRLIRDELFMLQLHILAAKKDTGAQQGVAQPPQPDGYVRAYLNSLPYSLTGAQARVIGEIGADSAQQSPMHRLLQGDVSSGKTTIAHMAVLNAVDNGNQGAIIAPTEILAEQLFLSLRNDPATEGVNIEFLGTKTPPKAREKIVAGLATGEVQIVIGTHAILEPDVQFSRLSTVVIDEQHRFGTAQRNELKSRGMNGKTPDLLIMTATPIPRTGALVLYGDLDLSILDELPPGRVAIKTQWVDLPAVEVIEDPSQRVWADIREQVRQGRQAYVVTSLIEDSEDETRKSAASAETTFEVLASGVLSGLRVGIMHGRMKRPAREQVMSSFSNGEIDVLVATTVIEVGVNVPNATIIAVLDSGNFGISQLHQIRGRVGRASYESRCYLIGDVKTPIGRERMAALVASTDGFYLSERDLELRGEGEVFGSVQSGVSDLKLASLTRDLPVVEEMGKAVQKVLDTFTWSQVLELRQHVTIYYKGKEISS